MGVAVRITLGRPPRWFTYPHEEICALAPPYRVSRIEDASEFRRKYRHHLYRVTADRLRIIFEEISERHGGKRLVLLCFEANPSTCHRSMFAEWWEQQTGQHVEELPESRAEQERLF
jgi:Protein of unknown function, DUF488